LFDLAKYGQGVCLARLVVLLDLLGIDRLQLAARSVVICGSNGKGSCAASCESIARHLIQSDGAGLKTGLFTSPHLIDFSERFQINRVPIGSKELAAYIERVTLAIGLCEPYAEQFGAFEAQFALACLYFQESDCDLCIFEAGIGGRYDPVRLVQSQFVALTSLDLEHTALLGTTLELIAYDKSDACPPLGSVFYGPNCNALISQLIPYNTLRKVRSVSVTRHPLAQHQRLIGQFQQDNASVAIALMQAWIKQSKFSNFSTEAIDAAIVAGLQNVVWNGRMQQISDQPLVIVDVGHTPDGIRAALQTLEDYYPNYDWLCVTGVSADKDASGILNLLLQRFNQFVCTQALHKGANAADIADQLERLSKVHQRALTHCEIQPSVVEAVQAVREFCRARESKKQAAINQKPLAVFVSGGLFLAVEFAQVWNGADPQALKFF
jgi:dihydrofolate synthase / folylpolyglutamate synthase